MSGILNIYFVDTLWARLSRVFYLLVMAVLIATSGPSFVALFAVMPMGYIVLMGMDMRLERYLHVMPIKPWVIVLARYLHSVTACLIGATMAVSAVFIFGGGCVVLLNFTLLAAGGWLTFSGAVLVFTFSGIPKDSVAAVISSFLILVPFLQLYLVFGPGTINDIIYGRMLGTPITSAYVFTNSARWFVFVAVSIIIYAGSYFMAVYKYKKSDYQPTPIWWWII